MAMRLFASSCVGCAAATNATNAAAAANAPAVRRCIFILVIDYLLLEAEDILALRALHSLLDVLLPHSSPRSAVEVLDPILDHRPRRERRRAAVHDEKGLVAVREIVRLDVVEVALPGQEANAANGLHERFLVVEDRLVLEPEQLAGRVEPRRADLARLQLARVFPSRVREPPLDVRTPRDQRVAVPKTDRLAHPARHVGAETRHRAGQIEVAAD